MLAKYRVKNSSNETVGFMVDGGFYNIATIKQNIDYIDNLSVLRNGVVRAKKAIKDIQYRDIVTRRRYAELKKEKPFDRDIANELKRWRNSNTTGSILQIRGTRQIGKTSEILKFAYSNYDSVIYVDLSKDRTNFESCMQTNKIKLELYKYCINFNLPKFDDSRNTVIVIDEIQESVKVFNSLRALRSELKCDIIITGSYLGTLTSNFTNKSQEKAFVPMGTIKPITMFSMSFREFCRAFGAEKILMNLDVHGGSEDSYYSKLESLYNIYRHIGGYPAVVSRYKETGNITDCYEVIEDLMSTFKSESSKYFTEPKQLVVFDTVFEFVITEMIREKRGNGKHIIAEMAKFIKESSETLISKDEAAKAASWLLSCNMLGTCAMLNGNNFADKQNGRRLYFLDCGIASYIMRKMDIAESAKRGLLTETFAFCELNRLYNENIHNRKVKESLCFSISQQYELDFILKGSGNDIDNTTFGIEVKTSRGKPESLIFYVTKKLVDKGILAKMDHGRHGNNIETIPIYAIGARFPYI